MNKFNTMSTEGPAKVEFNAVSTEELTKVEGGSLLELVGAAVGAVICPPFAVGVAIGYTATKIATH